MERRLLARGALVFAPIARQCKMCAPYQEQSVVVRQQFHAEPLFTRTGSGRQGPVRRLLKASPPYQEATVAPIEIDRGVVRNRDRGILSLPAGSGFRFRSADISIGHARQVVESRASCSVAFVCQLHLIHGPRYHIVDPKHERYRLPLSITRRLLAEVGSQPLLSLS